MTSSFGPGMDSQATITEWNPPHRFSADSRDDMGPDDPTIATEWIVEAKDGGTCVVRVVHSWFTSKDDWDEQFDGHTYGWINFFRILRLYLEHFSAQPCASIQVMGSSSKDTQAAWTDFTTALGISGAEEGSAISSAAGAPALTGRVEHASPPEFPGLLVRVSEPAPGIAHLFALPMGETVYLSTRFFLFGASAADAADRAGVAWQEWVQQRFPMEQ